MFDGHALLVALLPVGWLAYRWIDAKTKVRDDVRDVRRPRGGAR